MGQEIQYCCRCQVRIVGGDFDKGEAYRVGDQVACQKCAMEMLATAPLALQQAILDQKKRALDRKSSPHGPSSIWRGLMSVSPKLRAAQAAKATPRSQIAALAGIGLALVILVGMLLLSGESPHPPPPAPPVKPPPVVKAGPSPEELAAQGALQAAKSFARDNPSKLEEQSELFEQIAIDHARTPAALEAKRELEGISRKRKELVAAELKILLARAREMGGNAEYQKAADLLAHARKNHPEPEWTKPIDDRIRELEATMAAEFPALKDKAVDARKREGTAELGLIRDQVVRWGSARYADELEKSLAEIFPPITAKNNGNLMLRIADATLVGSRFKRVGEGDWSLTTEWRDTKDYVEWNVVLPKAGTYVLKLNYTSPKEYKGTPYGGEVTIVAADQMKTFTLEPTKTWGDYQTFEYGQVALPAGAFKVSARPSKVVNNLMSLRFVQFVPVK